VPEGASSAASTLDGAGDVVASLEGASSAASTLDGAGDVVASLEGALEPNGSAADGGVGGSAVLDADAARERRPPFFVDDFFAGISATGASSESVPGPGLAGAVDSSRGGNESGEVVLAGAGAVEVFSVRLGRMERLRDIGRGSAWRSRQVDSRCPEPRVNESGSRMVHLGAGYARPRDLLNDDP